MKVTTGGVTYETSEAQIGLEISSGADNAVAFLNANLLDYDSAFTYETSTNTLQVDNLTLTNALPLAQGGTAATSASAARTSLGLAIGTNVQAYDGDLAALAALSSTGMVARTASDTYVMRTITGTSGNVTVSNGDGVSGNPILSLPSAVNTITSITLNTGGALRTSTTATNTLKIQAYDVDGTAYTDFITLTAANTPTCDLSTAVTIGGNALYYATGTDVPLTDGGTGASSASGARTALSLVPGTDIQVFDADLSALAALSSTGIAVRSASNTWVQRSITAGTGISVSNGDGVSGNPQISVSGLTIGSDIQAYDADLAAIAALSTVGLVVRTGAGTAAIRSLTGTSNQITVSNSDGQSSNPQISLASSLSSITNITLDTGGALRTAIGSGSTLLLQAYNTSGSSYSTFGTLTAGAVPSLNLATSTTMGSNAIYYATGTDIPVTDGGTGSSTASGARTNLGVVIGTDVFTQRTITGTSNQITVSNGSGVSGNPTLSLPQDIATDSVVQFKHILQTTSFTGSPNTSQLSNTAATGQSDAVYSVTVSSTSGDAYYRCGVAIVGFYAFGVDGSDSNNFKMVYDSNSQCTPSDGANNIFTCNSSAFTFNVPVTTGGSLTLPSGKIILPATMTTGGTTGAQTINKASGSVNFAAVATSLVVTNSVVTTSSIVMGVIMTNDSTAVLGPIVPASGSFTIYMKTAPTAETKVGFVVYN